MSKQIRMDLHMHSCMSDDGEFTPKELMRMCKNANLQVVAIADHNSVEAVSEAKQEAMALGLDYIPAIELDCTIDGIELHILGYGIDVSDPAFMDVTLSLRKQEQESAKKRLSLAKEFGLHIDEETAFAISHHGCITGEIIAEVALADKRNHQFLKEYLPNGSRSDNPYVNFYWDYCSQGKPLYVAIEYMTLAEAVAMIQKAGGIAILAHPGNNTKENVALLDAIFKHDVKGLEVYSSYHTKEQIQFYEEYANTHTLAITCGSDFHGKTKPAIQLGKHGCSDTTAFYYALNTLLLHP